MRFTAFDDLSVEQRARARQIYEDGFAPELRGDFDGLSADRALACLEDDAEGARVVGLAVLRMMADPARQFLRYFVVGERGQGLGSRMWRLLAADVAQVVLDVEDPDEPGIDAEEEHERRRRIVFYERLGAAVLPVRSFTPPQEGGVAPPMLLLAAPAPDPADVAELVTAVYADRYGLPADHPVVRRTLADSGL